MRIFNTNKTQILQENRNSGDRAKIEHMEKFGYTSVIIDNHKVSFVPNEMIDDERVIVVNVEAMS